MQHEGEWLRRGHAKEERRVLDRKHHMAHREREFGASISDLGSLGQGRRSVVLQSVGEATELGEPTGPYLLYPARLPRRYRETTCTVARQRRP
jgi:hypothetical protein